MEVQVYDYTFFKVIFLLLFLMDLASSDISYCCHQHLKKGLPQ